MGVVLRMALTRLLIRLVEFTAIQKRGARTGTGPDHPADLIPGNYSKEEQEALRAIWRRSILRDLGAGRN